MSKKHAAAAGTKCRYCGQVHVAIRGGRPCVRHLSKDPKTPCSQTAMNGQNVCGSHGGRTQLAKAAAERRLAEARAEAELMKLIPDNIAPISDPVGVLAALAGEADAVRAVIVVKVNALANAAISDGELHAYVHLYERFLDRTARICEGLVRSNYLERHAAIEEAKIVALLAVLERGLRLIPDVELQRQVRAEISAGLQKLPTAS